MLKVVKPFLPTFELLAPYIRKIDNNRFYSNGGPLERELSQALTIHFQAPTEKNLCITSNGTLSLILTLETVKKQGAKFCLMPSWTFSAVAHSAIWANLIPVFLDVNPETLELSISDVMLAISKYGEDNIAAIILVSYHGKPITEFDSWLNLRQSYNIPIVIDAASGFANVKCSALPTIVSFHPTKIFSTGEGGCVFCNDISLIEKISSMRNFGFDLSRDVKIKGMNAKMSEYNAAIGLAFLDIWDDYQTQYKKTILTYQKQLATCAIIKPDPSFGETWISSSLSVYLKFSNSEFVKKHFLNQNIETKMWWGCGLHTQSFFRNFSHLTLDVTDQLASKTIGLPLYFGLESEKIEKICDVLKTISEV